MKKENYKSMVERILNDEAYYTKLKTNPEKDLQMKYKRFLKNYKIHMTEKEKDYLQNFEAKTSNFYGLPKVHKSKQINEKCKLAQSYYVEITEDILDLKLRPIVCLSFLPNATTQQSNRYTFTPLYEIRDQLPEGYNRFP